MEKHVQANPIIPWLGGKRRLADKLTPLFPPHECYVEVFCSRAAHLRLAGTYVENLSWLECMKRYDRPQSFFYLDPPYRQIEGYAVDFGLEQYEQMAEFMRTCKGKVMVSINDHPDIRRAFDGFTMMGLDIKYSIGMHAWSAWRQPRTSDYQPGGRRGDAAFLVISK